MAVQKLINDIFFKINFLLFLCSTIKRQDGIIIVDFLSRSNVQKLMVLFALLITALVSEVQNLTSAY